MTRITYAPSLITSWLDSGYRLVAGQFTYSIPGADSTWSGYGPTDETSLPGFAYPGMNLTAAFIDAVATWDELIAPDFTRVADDAAGHGEVRVAVTDIGDENAAYAYFPTSVGGRPGDIWLNASDLPDDWEEGSYGFTTLIHELGHTLGVDHPFVVNTAPASLDSQRYTVMSYNWVEERYVSFSVEDGQFFANFSQPVAETPMVLDIATVQQLYGADPDTRPNDTIYTFEAMNPSLQTIYDAGGTDTFELSAIKYTNVVDLQPGAYSSIAKASVNDQIAYWTSKFPTFASFVREIFTQFLPEKGRTAFTFTDNVGIALTTTIENVLGGSAADEISGNAAANVLLGNGGNDLLVGLGASDRLDGGDGDDQLYGNGIFVMPSGLATTPNDPAAPAPIVPPIVVPTPVDPVPPVDGGDSSGRIKIGGTAAAMQSLPHKIALAYVDTPEPERASLRLTISPADTPAPTPDPKPGPDPVVPTTPSNGGEFEDTLIGGAGNDMLMGGAGRDYLTGGTGADLFRFASGDFAGPGLAHADVISDFSETEGDRIDLSAIDAVPGIGDEGFRFLGDAAFTGAAGELRIAHYTGYSALEGETSGDGVADFMIRLDNLVTLSVGAIII